MCIGYLFMVPKKFSHRPPLYDLFDKAELCALSSPSTGESIDRRQHHRTSLCFFSIAGDGMFQHCGTNYFIAWKRKTNIN